MLYFVVYRGIIYLHYLRAQAVLCFYMDPNPNVPNSTV